MVKTVNEVLIIMKAVRERISDLKNLRSEVSKKERFFGSSEKTIEPQYPVADVDRRIVVLQNWLYGADAKIKESNARTMIDFDVDLNELLKPLS